MRLTIVAAAAGAVLAGACGPQQQPFTPAERTTARTLEGFTAAEYAINTRIGEIGDAKLFTRGAYRTTIHGQERTVVHVGLEIGNNSDEPIYIDTDRLRLDSAVVDGQVVRDIAPARGQGPRTIPPGSEGRLEILFALPPGIQPRNVAAFRVGWRLRTDGIVYRQRTPFVEQRQVYYYTPFYDPFYYEPHIFRSRVLVHGYPYRHYHVFR